MLIFFWSTFNNLQHKYNVHNIERLFRSLVEQGVAVVVDQGVQQGGGAVEAQRAAARKPLGAEHVKLIEAPVPVKVH